MGGSAAHHHPADGVDVDRLIEGHADPAVPERVCALDIGIEQLVAGLIQPADGGFWQLADYQGQLIASFIVAQECAPETADWFRKLKASARPDVFHGVTYIDSPRHKLEVQHYRYRTYIKKLLKQFGPVASMHYPASQPEAVETERATGGKRQMQAAE